MIPQQAELRISIRGKIHLSDRGKFALCQKSRSRRRYTGSGAVKNKKPFKVACWISGRLHACPKQLFWEISMESNRIITISRTFTQTLWVLPRQIRSADLLKVCLGVCSLPPHSGKTFPLCNLERGIKEEVQHYKHTLLIDVYVTRASLSPVLP